MTTKLRYQPVLLTDGTVAIHETIIDSKNTILSASYQPVKLEAVTFGELQELIRQVYRHMTTIKPITEEELEDIIFGSNPDIEDFDSDDKVIDLVTYMGKPPKLC